jgi:hypothetical protein
MKTGFPLGRQARGRGQERPLGVDPPASGAAARRRAGEALLPGRVKRRYRRCSAAAVTPLPDAVEANEHVADEEADGLRLADPGQCSPTSL